MQGNNRNHVVAYEYKDVTVARRMEAAYIDGYVNFGWELVETFPALQGNMAVALRLKRDRQVKNKGELNRLEREFENELREIERLEMKKKASIMGPSLGIGIVGLAISAGAVASFLNGVVILGVVLLIPAVACCVLGFVSSIRLRAKKTEQVAPQINGHYDAVYQTCEKAYELVNTSAA